MELERFFTDEEVESLGGGQAVLRSGFLGEPLVHQVRAAAASVDLRPAGTSRAGVVDSTVRGDAIGWLDPADPLPPWPALRDRFETLRRAANREAYLGLTSCEIQVARYPGAGEGYVRHVDSFAGPLASRRMTAIVYLNAGWQHSDGGQLRLHLAGGPVDVEPLLDRLVVFLSDRVEHEVLPARAPRLAITAWYGAR
jgi:SM-20-related protein